MSNQRQPKRRHSPAPRPVRRPPTESITNEDASTGLAVLRELAAKLEQETESGELDRGARRVGLVQICHILARLDARTLREQLEGDLRYYVGLLNALARLSRGGGDAEPRRRKPGEPEADGTEGLTPKTLEQIERQLKLL